MEKRLKKKGGGAAFSRILFTLHVAEDLVLEQLLQRSANSFNQNLDWKESGGAFRNLECQT